jgi:hypothetical protein
MVGQAVEGCIPGVRGRSVYRLSVVRAGLAILLIAKGRPRTIGTSPELTMLAIGGGPVFFPCRG